MIIIVIAVCAIIMICLGTVIQYKNNLYIESDEQFNKRLDMLYSKDGNHMIAVTALLQERERRIKNRNKLHLKSKH